MATEWGTVGEPPNAKHVTNGVKMLQSHKSTSFQPDVTKAVRIDSTAISLINSSKFRSDSFQSITAKRVLPLVRTASTGAEASGLRRDARLLDDWSSSEQRSRAAAAALRTADPAIPNSHKRRRFFSGESLPSRIFIWPQLLVIFLAQEANFL